LGVLERPAVWRIGFVSGGFNPCKGFGGFGTKIIDLHMERKDLFQSL